jgi:hypothetical protein
LLFRKLFLAAKRLAPERHHVGPQAAEAQLRRRDHLALMTESLADADKQLPIERLRAAIADQEPRRELQNPAQ